MHSNNKIYEFFREGRDDEEISLLMLDINLNLSLKTKNAWTLWSCVTRGLQQLLN